MFGGLHIMELAALKTIENLLESSVWTGELVQAGLAACGKAVSFLKASHMTSPLGDSLWLAPTIYWKGTPRTCEVNGAQHRTTEPMRWQTGAQFSRKRQVMIHCPAAVCTIYPVWQLPALYPVIDDA